MKISTNIQAKARIPLAVAILGLAGLGFEVSGIRTDIKRSENDAIIAGNLSKEDAKKMQALVQWEMQQRDRNYGMVDCYNRFASALKAGQTVDQIVNETLNQREKERIKNDTSEIQSYFQKIKSGILSK